jgi:hypothetical protein
MLVFCFIRLVGKGICKPISASVRRRLSLIRHARTFPSMMFF